jgi:hypothetical protein
MKQPLHMIAATAERLLVAGGHGSIATEVGESCAWLEACGYPGLSLLKEALQDRVQSLDLVRDALGLDLQGVSCVFLGPAVGRLVQAEGRIFLRNVRHGLYLLPGSVNDNYGIGCPVDPGFALGGERSKNPYGEKLAAAAQDGVEIDDSLWAALA